MGDLLDTFWHIVSCIETFHDDGPWNNDTLMGMNVRSSIFPRTVRRSQFFPFCFGNMELQSENKTCATLSDSVMKHKG